MTSLDRIGIVQAKNWGMGLVMDGNARFQTCHSPSDFVKQHAKQVVKEIGGDFVIIYVRRGNVITAHEEYWGIKKADVQPILQIS